MPPAGVGQVYLHTTNTAACTGSGIAMAQRAGVRLDNLEYVQFHPTALYTRQSHSFLITEAMRGEGARLTNAKGEFFMKRYDERADLAPATSWPGQSWMKCFTAASPACIWTSPA